MNTNIKNNTTPYIVGDLGLFVEKAIEAFDVERERLLSVKAKEQIDAFFIHAAYGDLSTFLVNQCILNMATKVNQDLVLRSFMLNLADRAMLEYAYTGNSEVETVVTEFVRVISLQRNVKNKEFALLNITDQVTLNINVTETLNMFNSSLWFFVMSLVILNFNKTKLSAFYIRELSAKPAIAEEPFKPNP